MLALYGDDRDEDDDEADDSDGGDRELFSLTDVDEDDDGYEPR